MANVGLDEGGKATQIQTEVGRGWEPGRPRPPRGHDPPVAALVSADA